MRYLYDRCQSGFMSTDTTCVGLGVRPTHRTGVGLGV